LSFNRNENRLEDIMIRIISGLAMAGMMVFSIAGQAQSQERALRAVTRGEAAPLQKSMTQAQARRLCAQQMRGARESKSAIRQKMAICVRRNMEGI
jgi:hypothetical protein